jgi:LacI family transcriptional regulator
MPQPRRVAIMLELESPHKRHTETFAGIQRWAEKCGWETILDEYVDDSLAAGSHYDGVIARATPELMRQAGRSGVPVVNVWASSPVADKLPSVFPDWASVGRTYAEHLLERGVYRFAAMITQSNKANDIALNAFQEVLTDANRKVLVTRASRHFSQTRAHWRRANQAINAWMDRWQLPIGIYVGSEVLGRITTQLCLLRGWRVPEDVAIVTGSNQESYCMPIRPTLTSIELDYVRVGYEAAQLLDRLMGARASPSAGNKKRAPLPIEQHRISPRGLIVRESTDFHAVGDESVLAALNFISANSHKPIGPNEVARETATHPRTLTNKFHQYLGRTIAQEIRRVRMERAKRELAETDKPLSRIAVNVGFGQLTQMYQVFCRETGNSPLHYRKQRQIQKDSLDSSEG